MKPEIKEVLAEANLTEAQIEQITGAVGANLATIRAAHIEEVTAIEKGKDAVIGGLMRDLLESKRLLAAAAPAAPVVVLAESLSLRDGALAARVVDGELVFESKDEKGAVRQVHLVLAASTDLMETALAVPAELDEKVTVKPRRIVAANGTSAVGIDLDTTGTLAFTVTDPEGSSLFELSRPDSEAVKEWFRMLQEAMEPEKGVNPFAKKDEKGEKGDDDDDDDDEIEERVRSKIIAEVNKMLVEAVRPYVPLMRQAKAHDKMKTLVENLHEAFGNVFTAAAVPAPTPEQLAESAGVADKTTALTERNEALAAENLSLRQSMLFAERTAGMAQTTRERVTMIVEAAHPANLQDFSDLLEVAIQSVKPVADVPAAATVEKGESKPPSLMQTIVDKL